MSFPSFWWWSWSDDQEFRSDACEKPGILCYGTGGVNKTMRRCRRAAELTIEAWGIEKGNAQSIEQGEALQVLSEGERRRSMLC